MPEKLIKAMDKMKLPKREKGDTVGFRKYKSLLQRWFGPKATDVKKDEKETVIERGSVITLDELTGRRFVVFVVWKVSGTKWHPSKDDDSPSWPLLQKEEKSYRLGVREVLMVAGKEREIEYMSNIVDGGNFRDTFRMMPVKEVKSVIFKVDV
mmetsp:Transcript_12748/g.16725  ORF Transcript_12748/g.16725 Transcript_12748/m.16725 type:complete len:153 (-) Transcript_12748:77-535(-)